MRSHHHLGCLNCGKRRKDKDIFSKRFDIYLKDSVSLSLIRVGLCEACFNTRDTLCLDHLKTQLHESELKRCEEKKLDVSNANAFLCARFVGRMDYGTYWDKVNNEKPNTSEEFVELVANERN